jgi:hypothetical protein
MRVVTVKLVVTVALHVCKLSLVCSSCLLEITVKLGGRIGDRLKVLGSQHRAHILVFPLALSLIESKAARNLDSIADLSAIPRTSLVLLVADAVFSLDEVADLVFHDLNVTWPWCLAFRNVFNPGKSVEVVFENGQCVSFRQMGVVQADVDTGAESLVERANSVRRQE